MHVTRTDPGLSPTGGCHNSLKPISSGPTITITAATAAAAAAMVSVNAEELRGLSPSIMQPYHFLTLTPIRIPLRTATFSGRNNIPSGKVINCSQNPSGEAGPAGPRSSVSWSLFSISRHMLWIVGGHIQEGYPVKVVRGLPDVRLHKCTWIP